MHRCPVRTEPTAARFIPCIYAMRRQKGRFTILTSNSTPPQEPNGHDGDMTTRKMNAYHKNKNYNTLCERVRHKEEQRYNAISNL